MLTDSLLQPECEIFDGAMIFHKKLKFPRVMPKMVSYLRVIKSKHLCQHITLLNSIQALGLLITLSSRSYA